MNGETGCVGMNRWIEGVCKERREGCEGMDEGCVVWVDGWIDRMYKV